MKQDVDSVMRYQEENMNDNYYMGIAIEEAKKAYLKDEVPVGAIIVKDDIVIAKAYNKRETNKSVLGHAEIEVIKKANKKLNTWILDDCILYVTLEPCLMCAGAIMQARIKRVVYGCMEPKFGSLGSIINVNDYKFNHHIEITPLVLNEESSKLLKDFFKEKRQKN